MSESDKKPADTQQFYKRLQYLLDKVGAATGMRMTRDQLARELGIAPSNLSAWFPSGGGRPVSVPGMRLQQIIEVFAQRGIVVEVGWFTLPFDEFKQNVDTASAGQRKPRPEHDLDPAVSTDDWRVEDANNIGQGMAALYLHPPPPSNDPNSFLLQVSLSLAVLPDEIEDLPVRLGLRQAWLVPAWTGCQPREWQPVEQVTETGGLLAISGPRDEVTKFLSGKPLERATVATMEYTTGGLPAVTLELRSRKLDLAVEPEAGADISTLRAKVLQRFLQECQIEDSERRVVWSRVKMERKPGRETDA